MFEKDEAACYFKSMRFLRILVFFIPVVCLAGPPSWIGVEFKREKYSKVSVCARVSRERFDKAFPSGDIFFLRAELVVLKRKRFFPDAKKKDLSCNRKLFKDPVRGVFVVKNDGESIFKGREEALSYFLKPVCFKVKEKYLLKKKYRVRMRIRIIPKIPSFPLSSLFYFGKKLDSGFFKVKYEKKIR